MKRLISQGLLAAAILSLSLPLAQAQVTTVTTVSTPVIMSSQEIVMGPFDASSSVVMPRLMIGSGSNLEVHLLNPSPNPLTFSSPDLNISYVVPANSERVVYIDPAMTASLTPGQEISYYIVDDSGNRLASSSFINEGTLVTTSTTTTTSTSTLAQELEAKYEINEAEVEPTYTEGTSAVRGFW